MPLPTNVVTGTSQNVSDTLKGKNTDDMLLGLSGDDVMFGRGGDDRMIGGKGSDVMSGGVGADTFVWSAGHIDNGDVDYVTDFNLNQGDMLQFLDSANGDIEILSINVTGSSATEQNGVDLRNEMRAENDVVISVMNTGTGAMQDIVLLDAWSASKNDAWVDLLADMGLTFGDNFDPEGETEVVAVEEELFITDDDSSSILF